MKHRFTTEQIDDFIVGLLPEEDAASLEQAMIDDVELALRVADRIEHLQEIAQATGSGPAIAGRAEPSATRHPRRELAFLCAAASLLICIAGAGVVYRVGDGSTSNVATNDSSFAAQADSLDSLADTWLAMASDVSLDDDFAWANDSVDQLTPMYFAPPATGLDESLEPTSDEYAEADDDWLGPLVQQGYLDGDA